MKLRRESSKKDENNKKHILKVKLERFLTKYQKYLYQISFLLFFLVAWEIFAWVNPFQWPPARYGTTTINLFGYTFQLTYSFLFPPPSVVFATFIDKIAGDILIHLSGSLNRLLTAYSISIAIALPIGMLIAHSKKAENSIDLIVKILYPMPGVAWLPLAILWFGLGNTPIIFVIFTVSFFTITVNTASAMKSVDPVLLSAAENFGAKGIRKFIKVLIPAAFPQLLTGLRIAWAYSWRTLAACEMLIATCGLGFIIEYGRMVHDMPIVMSGMILIGVMGFLIDKGIFGLIESRTIKRWGMTIART